jgi:hypothetical protein
MFFHCGTAIKIPREEKRYAHTARYAYKSATKMDTKRCSFAAGELEKSTTKLMETYIL